MSLANKLKPKIQKVINRFPTEVQVYREKLDKYKENLEEVKVCDLKGFYHEDNSKINLNITLTEPGPGRPDSPGQYIMVLIDEDSKQVKEGDILYIGEEKYIIGPIVNFNKLNIYFDLPLIRK